MVPVMPAAIQAEHGSTNFVHLRYGSIEEPETTLNGLEEVMAASVITGARLPLLFLQAVWR